ncbi:MAG: molybdopterin-dependent oxidoreductase [Burkholderiaceae bacterium]
MSRLALMIDLERCIGCKSCEAACKSEHGLGPGEYRNRVVWLGDTEQPGLDFLTLSCQHCERPACLRACPVNPKAIRKDPDTGVVSIDESRCTGCGECVIACPYGAMGYDAHDHHAIKCDLCSERRADGRRPACATVCPGEAITFGERDAHLRRIETEGRRALDHDSFLLGPANIFVERLRERPGIGERHETGEVPGAGTPPSATPGAAARIIGGHRPGVVDDPLRKIHLKPQAVQFPYRAQRDQRQPETVVPGGCNICFNCCPTQYHLRDGKVVRVTGNEDDPLWKGKVCPKSQFMLQLYNSEKRLTRPLKRVGARGEGRFEPISWEQALDEIAAKLIALRERHGPETLGIFAGTRTGTLTRRGYIVMFQQMWGTPNYSDTEAFCSEAKRLAYVLTQGVNGSGNSYTPTDMGSARLYVYFGDNQAESRPVHFGMINDWRIKNGARMIVVDPRLNVTASKADLWLPIRTGTDWAMALALAHHIFSTDQHDQLFCTNWVLGWEQWRDYLFEKGYTPEWAAAVTGISAAQIRALGDEIARADGCVIFGGRGLNQHVNGAQTNRALMFLAAITGNWGRKGGTYHNYGTGSPTVANAPIERRVAPARPSLGNNVTSWLEAMTQGTPYPMTALITGNNPMSAWPGQDRLRDAFKALELLVHIELFENETSRFADYVLPAATGVEKGEIGRAAEDRRVIWIDKVIDPPGQAWPDGWIWIELGRRLGFGDVLKEEYKDSALFWDEEMIREPEMRGCTQKRLHEAPTRWVRTPLFHEDDEEIETLYLEGTTAPGAPEGHRFPTKSGKLEFWTEELDARFRAMGLDALPEFYTDREQLIDLPWVEASDRERPPLERAGSAWRPIRIREPGDDSPSRQLRARGFDTELITGRAPAAHFHSWTHYSWQAQEMWPDLYVQIHPERARAKGIADGEEITIETAHGSINARAWLHAGIREQAVFVPIGWDAAQPYHPWRSVNYLTDLEQRDPVSGHSNLKTYLCRVSKA